MCLMGERTGQKGHSAPELAHHHHFPDEKTETDPGKEQLKVTRAESHRARSEPEAGGDRRW